MISAGSLLVVMPDLKVTRASILHAEISRPICESFSAPCRNRPVKMLVLMVKPSGNHGRLPTLFLEDFHILMGNTSGRFSSHVSLAAWMMKKPDDPDDPDDSWWLRPPDTLWWSNWQFMFPFKPSLSSFMGNSQVPRLMTQEAMSIHSYQIPIHAGNPKWIYHLGVVDTTHLWWFWWVVYEIGSTALVITVSW